MLEQTKQQIASLRLSGMLSALEEQQEIHLISFPSKNAWPYLSIGKL